MPDGNRTTLITLAALIVVALVLTQIVKRRSLPQVPDDHQEQVVTETETTVDGAKFSPIPPRQGERISYGAALRAFVGATIQFDAACRARPTTMSVQMRDQILLDNQSGKERTMSVGNRIYIVPAYDFVIISMRKNGTFQISCDDFEDVAVVGVQ